MLQNLDNNYQRERSRSKSNGRTTVTPGPEPRSYAPVPRSYDYNLEDMQIFREPRSRDLSMEPKKEVAAPTAVDKKKLSLSDEEIIGLKAFIWACGKNSDGELGLGFKDGEVCLPRNIDQLRDFPVK